MLRSCSEGEALRALCKILAALESHSISVHGAERRVDGYSPGARLLLRTGGALSADTVWRICGLRRLAKAQMQKRPERHT